MDLLIVLGALTCAATCAAGGVLAMLGVWKLAELWDGPGIHGEVTREDVR